MRNSSLSKSDSEKGDELEITVNSNARRNIVRLRGGFKKKKLFFNYFSIIYFNIIKQQTSQDWKGSKFEEMMHNNTQEKQMRLAKGNGVEELQAYYSLLGKYRGEKIYQE